VPRADELRTKRDVALAFVAEGSPRVLLLAVVLVLTLRTALGSWGAIDVAILVMTAVAIGPVEWFLHRHLLHAPEDAWSSRTLGTGSGHRQHHLDPPDIEWLLLRRQDAMVFAVLIAVASAAWVVPMTFFVGVFIPRVGALGPLVTAIGCAYLALAHYEWTHLLGHSRYRPKTRYYARLARMHRLHHYRNEGYWLGITSSLGDRVMGTYVDKNAVPLSATARSLS
jgi:sterol desaturase/sphingolipid hydroxylase (fatty acid hydroxylase superfamily)